VTIVFKALGNLVCTGDSAAHSGLTWSAAAWITTELESQEWGVGKTINPALSAQERVAYPLGSECCLQCVIVSRQLLRPALLAIDLQKPRSTSDGYFVGKTCMPRRLHGGVRSWQSLRELCRRRLQRITSDLALC
jgi:hypothetical protein